MQRPWDGKGLGLAELPARGAFWAFPNRQALLSASAP